MMSYRDRSFCDAPCATRSCDRKFTDADQAAAKAWWRGMSGDPPISFQDMSAGCHDYTPAPPKGET
jgi:hypothetical protein